MDQYRKGQEEVVEEVKAEVNDSTRQRVTAQYSEPGMSLADEALAICLSQPSNQIGSKASVISEPIRNRKKARYN